MGRPLASGIVAIAIGTVAGCDSVFGIDKTFCWNESLSADEDGDTRIDGCDNCPLLANPGQEDLDDDGVGDVCDPGNARAHRIAFFDPFDVIDDTPWHEAGTNEHWDYAGGGFKQDQMRKDAALLRYDDATFDEPTLFARVTGSTQSDEPQITEKAVAIYLVDATANAADATPPGARCGTLYTPEQDRAWVAVTGTQTGDVDAVVPRADTPTRLLRISAEATSASADAAMPSCEVTIFDGRVSRVSADASTSARGLRIGLWTLRSSAIYSGALVITPVRP